MKQGVASQNSSRWAEWPLGASGLLLALLFLAGCVSDRPNAVPRPPTPSRGPVAQLHLLTSPAALDLDSQPGQDGFGVQVYAINPNASSSVIITTGTLEVLMFDSLLKETNAAAATPQRVWTFPAAELKKLQQRSPFGMAYVLRLPWGQSPPTQPRVTLVARYLPPKGAPIYSGANAVSVAAK